MKEDKKDKHRYDDIIHLEHPVSIHRKKMSRIDRAAQFSPFAALTGFDIAIKEAARLTEHRVELDETAKSILDEKLRMITEESNKEQEVTFEFFQPDELKAGGAYVLTKGIVKKVDGYEGVIIMNNGTRILIEDIIEIRGEMFQTIEDTYA